jgi:acyl-CoA synthetase (AMP-forming)/AMP-acid ligase II
LQQTYGLSEIGILRSKSKSSDSLWVRLGGEGYETKVVDGTLWVRGRSAMVGYLNAASPFDAEGWLNTGDLVETDGEYFRFLGRQLDVINVGGQKVHPAEVESVLQRMKNVRDVRVRGERNVMIGQIVVADLALVRPEPLRRLQRRLLRFCRGKLAPYKIPAKIAITSQPLVGRRFKKLRPSRRSG